MTTEKIDKFKELLKKNPDNPLAHFSLANECYKIQMYEDTISHINNYLLLKDDEGAVYRMLADCYIQLEMNEKAIESYKKGIDAALKHGHEGMAEEFEEEIENIL